MEGDDLRLMRLKVYPREAFQRAAGSFDAAHFFTYIKLRNFVPFPAACICYINSYCNIALTPRNRSLRDEIVIAERGIAKPKSEGEQRLAVIVHILVNPRWVRVIEIWQLSYAARKSDGEPPGWIVLPKERLSNCFTSKLPWVPGFKNGGNMVLRPTNRQRAAIFQDEDNRLSSCDHRFEQLFLVARQIKTRPVEAFPGDALPLPQPKNNHIGIFCAGHCCLYILSRIKRDCCPRNNFSKTIDQTDVLAVGFSFVVAIPCYIGIRTNHSDSSNRRGKRQQMVVVLEKRHGFARRLKRESEILLRSIHFGIQAGVYHRMIEESQSKLYAENRPYRSVQLRLRQGAFPHTVNERLLKNFVRKVIKLHIHTGFDGEAHSIFRRGGDVVHGMQTLHRA